MKKRMRMVQERRVDEKRREEKRREEKRRGKTKHKMRRGTARRGMHVVTLGRPSFLLIISASAFRISDLGDGGMVTASTRALAMLPKKPPPSISPLLPLGPLAKHLAIWLLLVGTCPPCLPGGWTNDCWRRRRGKGKRCSRRVQCFTPDGTRHHPKCTNAYNTNTHTHRERERERESKSCT
jgi:hypothetical protein